MKCPICATETNVKRGGTPYWICSGCGLWFQSPLPPKRWHGPHEVWLGQPMPDAEKAANEALAKWLFEEVMHKRAGPTLDVGASYPYLAHCLGKSGCPAFAMDASEECAKNAGDLGVLALPYDFESDDWTGWDGRDLALISFVHSFEHLYDPLKAMRRLREIVADDGALFIRMPDNHVPGYERDLTPGHLTIHPYFHSLSSIAELCSQTNMFVIESTSALLPGQRDNVLRPI